MIQKTKVSVNKYPFLMWLNYFTDVDVDKQKKIVTGERSSSYEKANMYEILFLKYIVILPLLFIAKIPSLSDLIPLSFGFVLCVIFFILFKKSQEIFKYIGLAFSILLIILVLFGYLHGRAVNNTLQYFILFFIIGYIYNDFKNKNFKNYYKLLDIKNSGKVNFAKRSESKKGKIPFTHKYLFSGKKGMNLSFNYNFKGYYFYILDNQNQGVNNEN